MKRIYWFFPHLEQDGGGTKFLFEVTKRLAKKYDVTIICNTGTKKLLKEFSNSKINVITTSFISANSNIYWLILPVFILFDLLAYSSKIKNPHVILSTMYPANFLAHWYSKLFRKTHIHYCYEPFPYLQNPKFIALQPSSKRIMMSVFSTLYAWTDTLAVKSADKVLTLNEVTKRMIKKVYNKSSVVTFMGVNTSHFKPYSNTPVHRKYKKRALITHSTDYSQLKHTELAIEAIKKVVKRHPNVLLVITSTYPKSPNKKVYKEMVKKYDLTKNVEFVNYIPYNLLPYYYSASICYLSCSYDEMLGTTTSNLPVKEALACETPAIRAPVTKEDVIDGVTGYLVDPRKSEDVAKKLSYFISHPKIAREMGKRGRKMIKERYSWNKVAKIIEQNLK